MAESDFGWLMADGWLDRIVGTIDLLQTFVQEPSKRFEDFLRLIEEQAK